MVEQVLLVPSFVLSLTSRSACAAGRRRCSSRAVANGPGQASGA